MESGHVLTGGADRLASRGRRIEIIIPIIHSYIHLWSFSQDVNLISLQQRSKSNTLHYQLHLHQAASVVYTYR